MEWTKSDLEFLQKKGIPPSTVEAQLQSFVQGFPYVPLLAAATLQNGILRWEEEEANRYKEVYENFDSQSPVVKFVPASGAATRMFQDVYAYYNGLQKDEELRERPIPFIRHLEQYAFYPELEKLVEADTGTSIARCLHEKNYLPILENTLEKGLSYARLPKALIPFHRYREETRCALEEHLVEAALYACKNGICHLHFSISPEFKEGFLQKGKEVVRRYENRYKVKYRIGYSEQKSCTDTVAVHLDNEAVRDKDGNLVFRPAGHGALIDNLNEIDADIIFIKNIDNVTTDERKPNTVLYKKALAGFLISVREEVFEILHHLASFKEMECCPDTDTGYQKWMNRALAFCRKYLGYIPAPQILKAPKLLLQEVFDRLNRPIRVCGMVKNSGEPGGGPFWVKDHRGSSLQIVESSQVDKKDAGQMQIFSASTHFNPVDLVCSTKNYAGEKFDLKRYVNYQTYFIARKSYEGTAIKAMELPGLWNGSMYDWLSLFVEVPETVFSPVKTIDDLLRPQHQNRTAS